MKERPILFSGTMVCAILEGRKTQTRRIIRPQPQHCVDFYNGGHECCTDGYCVLCGDENGNFKPSPFGEPGDRLWVREQWQAWTEFNHLPPSEIPTNTGINYLTDSKVVWDSRRRASMHMPRWASRILLEVTDIRVERLQEISAKDALAEGIRIPVSENGHPLLRITGPIMPDKFSAKHPKDWTPDDYARFEYADLWESINGKGSWEANPYVWVIEFRRIEP
jgi:hypothetical protein